MAGGPSLRPASPELVRWDELRGGGCWSRVAPAGWRDATGCGSVPQKYSAFERVPAQHEVKSSDRNEFRRLGGRGEPAVQSATGNLLNILVTFADAPTRERAARIHDLLVEALVDEYSLRFTWWKFDLLTCSDMFEAAVEAAVRADVLLFSVHAADRWPPHVQSWIEAWKDKREQRCRSALVALIGGADQLTCQLSPAHALLQRVACQAGMDFVPHVFPLMSETPCCLVDRSSEPARHLASVLEQILTRPAGVPDWGINE